MLGVERAAASAPCHDDMFLRFSRFEDKKGYKKNHVVVPVCRRSLRQQQQ